MVQWLNLSTPKIINKQNSHILKNIQGEILSKICAHTHVSINKSFCISSKARPSTRYVFVYIKIYNNHCTRNPREDWLRITAIQRDFMICIKLSCFSNAVKAQSIWHSAVACFYTGTSKSIKITYVISFIFTFWWTFNFHLHDCAIYYLQSVQGSF